MFGIKITATLLTKQICTCTRNLRGCW